MLRTFSSEQRQISFVQIEDRNLKQILKPYLFLKRGRPPFAQEEVLFLRKIHKKVFFLIGTQAPCAP